MRSQATVENILSEPAAARNTIASAAGKTRYRVMVADDHPVFRRCLIQALQGIEGLTVIAYAVDGQEAVELAIQLHPDLVVMDVNMPRMSGIEVTREISRSVPDVRIVGLSMDSGSDYIGDQMRAAGAVCHISKESDPDILLDTIKYQLSLTVQ